MSDWDESKHPRKPEGSAEGGQWIDAARAAAGLMPEPWGQMPKAGSLDRSTEMFGKEIVRWARSKLDFDPPVDDWLMYEEDVTKIRDSYVVDDAKTLRMNHNLRLGRKPTVWAERIDGLINTKIREDSLLYRGAVIEEDTLRNLLWTRGMKDLAFMSVSGDKGLALTYLGIRDDMYPGRVSCLFHLVARAGTKIGFMDMGEFVLARGTEIDIAGYSVNENGRYDIYGEIR